MTGCLRPRRTGHYSPGAPASTASMFCARANITLAAERAQRIVDYLQKRGVDGSYTVNIATSFIVGYTMTGTADTEARAGLRTGPGTPMSTDAGKPLTTVTVIYDVEGPGLKSPPTMR